MKAYKLRGRTIAVLVAVASVLNGGLANAANYFEQTGYEDEMFRCIGLIRPSLSAAALDTVTYDVQEIELRGPWYQFEISVTVQDNNGNKSIDGYKVGCKSNRWIETAELEERRNDQALPFDPELFASK